MPCSLQVLLCTIGAEGIARLTASRHPRVEGVGYLVAWQLPDGDCDVPQMLLERDDFEIVVTHTRGISRNRNIAIESSSAPLCLMGDDDVDYSAEGLRTLAAMLEAHPDTDVAACRYTCCGRYVKPYPEDVCPERKAPRGWYITAYELAFRRERVTGRVRFNEKISIGTEVIRCGEEDVFLIDARRAGLSVSLFPVTIGAHDRDGTGERCYREPWWIMAHGAIMRHKFPFSWIPRVFVHALRAAHKGHTPFFSYMRHALAGGRYASRTRIFEPETISSDNERD